MHKIKVVWICWFVNQKVHSRIKVKIPFWKRILKRQESKTLFNEIARWNTNALNEFEKFEDVELHVICPFFNMVNSLEEFMVDNVHYHIYKNQLDFLSFVIKAKFVRIILGREPSYNYNRYVMKELIEGISPDVVHVMGAENAFYSQGLLDVPKGIPTIIQLQTLLSDPEIVKNYPVLKYRITSETRIIRKAKYVGTCVERFRKLIKENIKENAIFVNIDLALTEELNKEQRNTEYDFVYFAVNIDKAVDLAVEAFALAHKKYPNIILNIIGGYTETFKNRIDKRISELGITGNVRFEGRIPRYEDVIKQIRKSRFALLPLRTDIISSTIREAMANGIPTLTTITPGTPSLNSRWESVLLSKTGDHQSLADNMIRLLEDPGLAQKLSKNAFLTSSLRENNSIITRKWIKAYKEILAYEREGKRFSKDIVGC